MTGYRKKQYIERLAEVLILNAAGERHLAMFSAYLDESGKGNERDSFIAVGGLVSSSTQWGRLQVDWDRHLLRVPGMPIDGNGRPVPFHMTTFESGHWPFKDYEWRSAKAKAKFLDGLVDIMRHRIKLRVFAAMWLHHYHILFAKDKKFKLPWTMCALGCASRISKWAEQKQHPDSVPFIFERGGEGWGLAIKQHQELEKKGQLGKTKIGNWSLDGKHIAGLQAADLWAWELRRYFQAQAASPVPMLEIRHSLDKLIRGIPDGRGFVIGGPELEALMEDLREGTSTVPAVPFGKDGVPTLIPEALYFSEPA